MTSSADDGADLAQAVRDAREELGEDAAGDALPLRPALGDARHGRHARQGGAARGRAPRDGEAVRARRRVRARAQRRHPRALRRGAGLPHRPLPRQGGGAGHPRAALRQRPVRADLGRRARRGGPDRHPGGPRPRGPRRVLRGDGRAARHGRHPPLPAARPRGDGAAGARSTRPACATPSWPPSRRCSRWTRPRSCSGSSRATATRTTSPRTPRRETFAAVRAHVDNDRWRGVPFLLRTGKALAEGRQVVSVVLRAPEHDLFGVDGDGRPDEIALELTDDPQLVRQPAGQAAGPGARADPRRPDARRRARDRRGRAGRLRAPAARRHGRRPAAVHARGRGRAAVGGRRAGPRGPAGSRSPTPRARGVRTRRWSSPSRSAGAYRTIRRTRPRIDTT